mmetsp:Transcript_11119/g.29549  ORF Transcript_11119/g.29549 Transcript_11119/m.29549 type:complete len:218 (+) Transcript_11119:796-1449(+)
MPRAAFGDRQARSCRRTSRGNAWSHKNSGRCEDCGGIGARMRGGEEPATTAAAGEANAWGAGGVGLVEADLPSASLFGGVESSESDKDSSVKDASSEAFLARQHWPPPSVVAASSNTPRLSSSADVATVRAPLAMDDITPAPAASPLMPRTSPPSIATVLVTSGQGAELPVVFPPSRTATVRPWRSARNALPAPCARIAWHSVAPPWPATPTKPLLI